jgi:beta-N-acetylhexosaminidase
MSELPDPAPEGAAPPSAPSVSVPPRPPCQPAPIEVRAATVLAVGIGEATTADAPLPATVTAAGVGGVILLGPNVVDVSQVRALIEGLRRQSAHGLLVTVDEEGGRVSRLRSIIGPTPSARALGRRSLAEIADIGAERGATLRDLGFDLVLAPVADADGGPAGGAIGDRAFGGSPAEAGPRAGAFARGLSAAGVAATAKHFPGQGGLADSHDGQVVFDQALDEVRTAAESAFRPVIDAGARAVMMSHVTFSALGSRPASLEPGAYRMLRAMDFKGAAITDAIGMEAILEQWSLAEAAVLALIAGADLVLATPGDKVSAMRDAVVAAVADGRLPETRLDEAVARVLSLRGEEASTMVCR